MTRLTLNSCDGIDGARLATALEGCPLLEELTLQGCVLLHSLSATLLKLKVGLCAVCARVCFYVLPLAALQCAPLASTLFQQQRIVQQQR